MSFKEGWRHLLLQPPHSSRLISLHRLSSDYGLVHLVVSADGGFNDMGRRVLQRTVRVARHLTKEHVMHSEKKRDGVTDVCDDVVW